MVLNYRGKSIEVDDIGYKLLLSRKWCWIDSNQNGLKPKWYLLNVYNKVTTYFHRELIGAKKGQVSDHKDGNTLNCKRDNLRVVTNSENRINASGKTGKLLPKGVFQKKGSKMYFSSVQRKGVNTLYKGSFTDVIDAAKWYQDNSK